MGKIVTLFFTALGIILPNIVYSSFLETDKNIVVYGDDNRFDMSSLPSGLNRKKQALLAQWSQSIAAMVSVQNMQKGSYDLFFTLDGRSLGEEMNLCKNEKFYSEQTSARCTGFLIAPDLLLTAGHCMDSTYACEGHSWIFDFKSQQVTEGGNIPFVWKKDVYECSKIISLNQEFDYAIVKLDRSVEGRTPLRLRTNGKIKDNAKLVTMGHPSGLPFKIADKGTIRENANDGFFVANLDTFHGNSGSPVFNWQTGLVEGILVRGEDDYKLDREQGCYKTNICEKNQCRGEDVIRTTMVKELLK